MSKRRKRPWVSPWRRAVTPEEIEETRRMMLDYLERREGTSTTPESRAARTDQLLNVVGTLARNKQLAFDFNAPADATPH